MLAHRAGLFAQTHQVLEGVGPPRGIAQQRRGVVHRHELKAALFHPLPMLARDLEVLADQAHGRDAAEADDQLRAQQRHLLAQIADAVKITQEALADLGADEKTAFWKVTLPLSMPGVISGISMVFLPAMTNYVVLDMLYNSTYIMGSLIGSYFSAYNWHGGSMIALILLAFICLFTLLTGTGEDDHRRGGSVL